MLFIKKKKVAYIQCTPVHKLPPYETATEQEKKEGVDWLNGEGEAFENWSGRKPQRLGCPEVNYHMIGEHSYKARGPYLILTDDIEAKEVDDFLEELLDAIAYEGMLGEVTFGRKTLKKKRHRWKIKYKDNMNDKK